MAPVWPLWGGVDVVNVVLGPVVVLEVDGVMEVADGVKSMNRVNPILV